MNIELLRQATAADHSAVEDSVPLMSSDLTLEVYVATLQRIYGIATAWETASEQKAPLPMQAMLFARKRASRITNDLLFLGSEPYSQLEPLIPDFQSEAEFLGAMYVMEGSRLGGSYIARHVASVLLLREGFGDTYFRGDPQSTSAMWKEFLEYLRVRISENETPKVIQGAKAMFQLYGTWMRDNPAEKNLSSTVS
ncbi:N/A [soil metagenome]